MAGFGTGAILGGSMTQLGRKKFPQHVVMVIDRRDGEMRFRSPIRFIPTFRPMQLLIPLHQVPPQAIQLLIGILVQDFF